MKHTYQILALVLVIAVVLSGCAAKPAPVESDAPAADAPAAEKTPPEAQLTGGQATLYLNLSGGDPDPPPHLLREVAFTHDGAVTPQLLVQELSDYTGLNFAVAIDEAPDGLIVDWAADSTLLTGIVMEEKEDFPFYDVDTTSWFMLDSLWETLTKNLSLENVYYTMQGGEPLRLDAVTDAPVLDATSPYMGSAFYFAHSDLKGDDIALPIASEEEALNLLTSIIPVPDGAVMMGNLEIEIEGVHGWSFILGEDTEEKFTGSHFYAVCEDGAVYETDMTGSEEYVRIN